MRFPAFISRSQESAPLKKMEWIYLYIDEAHRIKNENSILSRVRLCCDASC
jgi:SNF2 family DNA or RNA helicase